DVLLEQPGLPRRDDEDRDAEGLELLDRLLVRGVAERDEQLGSRGDDLVVVELGGPRHDRLRARHRLPVGRVPGGVLDALGADADAAVARADAPDELDVVPVVPDRDRLHGDGELDLATELVGHRDDLALARWRVAGRTGRTGGAGARGQEQGSEGEPCGKDGPTFRRRHGKTLLVLGAGYGRDGASGRSRAVAHTLAAPSRTSPGDCGLVISRSTPPWTRGLLTSEPGLGTGARDRARCLQRRPAAGNRSAARLTCRDDVSH